MGLADLDHCSEGDGDGDDVVSPPGRRLPLLSLVLPICFRVLSFSSVRA
jgi:hypothetical protein